jgi:predicted ATP-dependent protease
VAAVQYTFTHKQYTDRPKNKQYIEQHKKQYIEQHKKQYIEQHKKQYIEQHKKYIEQHKNVIGTVRAVPRLGEIYPGILPYNRGRSTIVSKHVGGV